MRRKNTLVRRGKIPLHRERDRVTLKGISRVMTASSPPSPDEELKLVMRAKQGDITARDRLILSHIRFVFSMAREYEGTGLPLVDIVIEGLLGLIHAIEYYNETYPCRFISYAVWWIRKYMENFVYAYWCPCRVPPAVVEEYHRMKRIEEIMYQKKGTNPPPGEIKIDRFRRELMHVVTLMNHAPSEEIELTEYNHGGNWTEKKDTTTFLSHFLKHLSKEEEMVFIYIMGLNGMPPLGFKEVSAFTGIKYRKVQYLWKAIKKKLRSFLKTSRQ